MIARLHIDWRPIAEIPADRKDGRRVLLWAGEAEIGAWGKHGSARATPGWGLGDGSIVRPTHWADINSPEDGWRDLGRRVGAPEAPGPL